MIKYSDPNRRDTEEHRAEVHLEVLHLLLKLFEGLLVRMVGGSSEVLVNHPGGHLVGQFYDHLSGKGHVISEEHLRSTD